MDVCLIFISVAPILSLRGESMHIYPDVGLSKLTNVNHMYLPGMIERIRIQIMSLLWPPIIEQQLLMVDFIKRLSFICSIMAFGPK